MRPLKPLQFLNRIAQAEYRFSFLFGKQPPFNAPPLRAIWAIQPGLGAFKIRRDLPMWGSIGLPN
jgi:hypothetical protein